jgi:hypothetical protein
VSFEELPTPAAVAVAHTSAVVFPELPEDMRPYKFEWLDNPGLIKTMCGCMVEVYPGDTVWALPLQPDVPLTVLAIDPVTIH